MTTAQLSNNAQGAPSAQLTDTVLMVAPYRFGFNPDAADTNSFMQSDAELSNDAREQVARAAAQEFVHFAEALRHNGVHVVEIKDTPQPHTPDSIFPNNWISTHADGRIVLYPMEPLNRRLECRDDIITLLQKQYGYTIIEDLRYFEGKGIFLEGTGSLVLDRQHRVVYANRSSRMHPEALQAFCAIMGYAAITFSSHRKNGGQIYHTNVMMAVGENTAVVCSEAIVDDTERSLVLEALRARQNTVVEITEAQMDEFAGNMLQVRNDAGEKLWVMSTRAYEALFPEQHAQLEQDARILHASLDTIEHFGGGSARCMLAEVFPVSVRE